MSIRTYFLSFLLLSISSAAQAIPVITVLAEDFSLSSYARLQNGDGDVTLYESNYNGSALAGDQAVDAIDQLLFSKETYSGGTFYEEFSVEANANISRSGNSFNLWAESDKYSTGWDTSTAPTTYYQSIDLGAEASLKWTFSVTGGDVDLNYYVADEHVRTLGAYPSGWDDESLSSLSIFDETLNMAVVDVAGWFTSGYTSLHDGHTYTLEMIARDDHFPTSFINEEDVDTGLAFSDALIVVDIAEPSSLALLSLSLLGLGLMRFRSLSKA